MKLVMSRKGFENQMLLLTNKSTFRIQHTYEGREESLSWESSFGRELHGGVEISVQTARTHATKKFGVNAGQFLSSRSIYY